MKPFLKWAGGKRWLVEGCSDLFPTEYNRYIEPFLGGGAVYFHLLPEQAILADVNSDLIDAYKGIKKDWKLLTNHLRSHQRGHFDDYYYEVRDKRPSDLIERAARLIYLNRTCFNGIYRVNLNGTFNVPRGTKDTVLYDDDDFEATSKHLRRTNLIKSDFEKVIDRAESDDFIFSDPPYTVHHNYNGFVKYNEKLFSWDDQRRLVTALSRARDRGVKILATNANHEMLRGLYLSEAFYVREVSRYSSISSSNSSRKNYEELIISSHPMGGSD